MLLEQICTKQKDFRIHIDSPLAYKGFQNRFVKTLREIYVPAPIIVLCIGTDRSTGDALGPLVGERLHGVCQHARVLGNLKEPVHAVNLSTILND